MKCVELIQKLETLAPSGCACDWDNVGLLVGWQEQEIHRILIALDATDEVVGKEELEEAKYQMRWWRKPFGCGPIFCSHTTRLFLNR